MKFSVVIPVLNEEAVIHDCVANIWRLNPDAEIIVADGGSSDDSVSIVRSLGVRLCQSEPGRGHQCNAGAGMATGDVLVFLHADTRLPERAFQKLREAFSDARVQCGTFRISFDVDHPFLRFLSFMSLLDLGIFRFGDQCLVIRKSFFDSIGGFPPWRLFEDIELVRRARRKTRIRRFPAAVTTSARRYVQNGVIRHQAKNTWYTLRYLLGTSPEKLAVEYWRADHLLRGTSLNLFLRYPRPGSVKTRLGATVGDPAAADFYRLCAASLVEKMTKMPGAVRRKIWYTGGTEREMADWLGRGLCYELQPDGDIGVKLAFAFDRSFRQGARQVIVLASDVPDVSAELIVKAFRSLEKADMVLGPSFDGGYYLIGLRQPHPELFQGISWSTDMVLRQTADTARRLGIVFKFLPMLTDIDTREDLRAWLSRSGYSPAARFARSLDLEEGK